MYTSVRTNNRIESIGRVAKITTFKDVTIITLAIDNGKDREGNEIPSTFVDLKSFDEKAVKNLETGLQVQIYSHFKNNNYTDKNGVKHYDMDLVVDTVVYLESKAAVEARKAARAASATA